MKTTITNKNFNLNYLLYLISFLIVTSCCDTADCESEIVVIDTNDVTLDHPDFSDVIESYNATYSVNQLLPITIFKPIFTLI